MDSLRVINANQAWIVKGFILLTGGYEFIFFGGCITTFWQVQISYFYFKNEVEALQIVKWAIFV